MLFSNLRKHTKTIVWAIAIIIVPAFVLWNIGSAVSNRRSGFAGKIYGKKIPWKEFIIEKRAARNEAWLKYGDQADQVTDLDEQTWTRLILLEKAKQEKIKVSDKELLNYIQKLPTFRFAELTPENYNMIIARIFQQNPSEFEKGMRNSLMISKLMEKIVSDINATDAEVKEAYYKEFSKVDATYLLIDPEDFADQVSLENAGQEIKKYYETHKEDFKKPEQVDVEYIEIPLEMFKAKVDISDKEIEEYYEDNKEDFKLEDEGKKRQAKYKTLDEESGKIKDILTEKKMQEKALDTGRQIVNKLYADVDMRIIAEEFGLSSKQTGPFSMLEEIPDVGLSFPFLKAAFSLGIGEVSEVIQTPTALYILKPTKKIPPYIPSFENITEQVTQTYKKQEAKKIALEKSEQIRKEIIDLMKKDDIDFEQAAKRLNYPTKKVKGITRSGYVAELGYAQDFTNTVFSLKINQISGIINTASGICIAKLDNIIDVDPAQFEKEKESYRNKVIAQKKNEFLNKWFKELQTEASPESYVEENPQ
jgi:peptidyl-prolyl cis-trans isomerase D